MPDLHKQRVARRVFKILITLFIVAVNGILLWRIFFSTAIPSSVKSLSPNDSLRQAYLQHGKELTLCYQDTHSTIYQKDKLGYFSNAQVTFIPEANQVQVVIRYNNGTLRHLGEDFAPQTDESGAVLEEQPYTPAPKKPDKSKDWFDFSLVVATDRTPADDTDNQTSLTYERLHPTSVTRDETLLYTYYRLVFEGVVIDGNDVDGIFVDAYYVGALDYTQEAYGTLCIYDCRLNWKFRDLTKADIRALS
ncbi:MAG: hypothetical protein E7637_05000 [Ruminococcaceae bacterium]|nr:hypothetical protein [Oscillospiraceae bacterium]